MTAADYAAKCRSLRQQLAEYVRQPVAVAFSGGVDSSLLLKLVCQAAGESVPVYAVTMQGQLNGLADIEAAVQIAGEIGAASIVIEAAELSQPGIAGNPPNRCYWCKRYLFSQIKQTAAAKNCAAVLDGTNADDLTAYRPGLKALSELGIISPLAAAGFTKAEVRRLAAELGLAAANKPARPCLATRFPYNTELTTERLRQAEQAEAFILQLGFYNMRVRVHGDIVRLEVDRQDFAKAIAAADKITAYLQQLGYVYITLDLEGFRSGSMDVLLKNRQ